MFWSAAKIRTIVNKINIYILGAGPSLADAGPGARYGVGPPSVRLQWRYGGGGGGSIPFVAGRGARCDRTSCTAQRTALIRGVGCNTMSRCTQQGGTRRRGVNSNNSL